MFISFSLTLFLWWGGKELDSWMQDIDTAFKSNMYVIKH